MTDHKALRLVDVLRDQRQCDEDGVMCIVSRQAVDEAVQIIESLTAAPADHKAGWVLVPLEMTDEMVRAFMDGSGFVRQAWKEAIAAAPAASEGEDGLAEFTDYFVKNYPGPDTIIHDPKWHAPRIYRAAQHAMRTRPAAQVAATPKQYADGARAVALLREVCEELEGIGCGPCAGSMAPFEDLHGRIAHYLATPADDTPKHDEGRDALPRLPAPQKECWIGHQLFSAEQMRDYARAALATQPAAQNDKEVSP